MEVLTSMPAQLAQLDALLGSIDSSAEQHAQLVEARTQLLESWMHLFALLRDEAEAFGVGAVCLAPRMFDRVMAEAVVVAEEDEQRVLKWLRPRSRYEVTSSGTRFHIHDLQPLPREAAGQAHTFRIGQEALTRYDDGVWYNATVEQVYTKGLAVDDDRIYVRVRFRTKNATREVMNSPARICEPPMRLEHTASSPAVDSQSEEDDEKVDESADDDADESAGPHEAQMGDNDQAVLSSTASVCEPWEQHTRGIGSKLMEKMGYRKGEGLGKHKQGPLEPIPIRVLPAGVGLDFVKEDPVARRIAERLDNIQRVQREQREKQQSKHSMLASVNRALASAHAERQPSQLTLQGQSDMVKSLHAQEHIRKLESKLQKLQESFARNERRDPVTAANVRKKITQMEAQLAELQARQQSLQASKPARTHRRTKTKNVF